MVQTELMQAFQFTRTDLDANQHGFITKEQKLRLRRAVLAPFFALPGLALKLLGVLVIPAVCVYPILALKFPTDFLQGKLSAVDVLITTGLTWGSLFAMLVIRACIIVLPRWWRVMEDLRKGAVRLINGRIYLDESEKAVLRGVSYVERHLKINGLKFVISEEEWLALSNSENRLHRVYYAAASRIILSIEQVNSGTPPVVS